MATVSSSPRPLTEPMGTTSSAASVSPKHRVALLTGGFDQSYAFGLSMALASRDVCLDVIGSDDVDSPEMHATPGVNFLNLWGSKPEARFGSKARRALAYYAQLLRYAAVAEPEIFHILWNNKFEIFDRTVLMLYYKMLGKKIVFTAHNVNAGQRDSNDSLLNRLTLRAQYLLADHIFVHTDRMKHELQRDFGVPGDAITVIPFGINIAVPHTDLSPGEAKKRLGLTLGEKTILFFGAIRPYKGLEYLVDAFLRLAVTHPEYRLIIAGDSRKEAEKYLTEIQDRISAHARRNTIIMQIRYIADAETELYFKAADVLALPYAKVFQSGVLFLAHSFGLPVIAADVGSLRDDIIEGQTGYVCQPCDPIDIAGTIESYFASDLYRALDERRSEIKSYALARHSWDIVGESTCRVYRELLSR